MAARRRGRVVVFGVVLAVVLFPFVGALGEDSFWEELFFKPLQSGHVYSHFQFTTSWNVSLTNEMNEMSHYNLFPKALGQVITRYSVQELHISLTQGQWRSENWGYPITSAPSGAQLWVWFKPSTPSVDESWKGLINALSGLFCASLNFIDDTNSAKPRVSFKPSGLASESFAKNAANLRFASLPRENVCTENLTPWKKLLPCDSKAGLSSLFHAGNLYNANYHSLAVDLRPVCDDYPACTRPALELSQSLAVVFNPPASHDGKQDWTLRSLFDRPLSNVCPMAEESKIYIDISDESLTNPWLLTPEYATISNSRGRTYAVYDLKEITKEHKINVAMKWNESVHYASVKPPHLHAHRFLSGFGQEQGGITCQLFNSHATEALRVIYMETVPWFIRLYLHTLKIENSLHVIKPEKQLYTPGNDRSNPYLLELVLTLPPQSVTTLSVQFDKAFLKWTEYPPDANIGFHISSAVVSTIMPSHSNFSATNLHSARLHSSLADPVSGSPFLRLYTEPLLIQLPVPDFSMPYNVICLTCTVVAIGFGSLHNLTTRRFVLTSTVSADGGLKSKILKFFKRSAKDEENTSDDEGDKDKTVTRDRRAGGDNGTDLRNEDS
ncbi:GPI transamidase component PIG-T-like [Acanthaster planci]|uniref:GPI transamidase component PIG-T-like n=1 Tax=Acanthaster planci TaxID=133434 RepID=A0A8B7XNF7_ACAPL|nr:GPI transamidase component PIG-T-like [Acanthaster planci]